MILRLLTINRGTNFVRFFIEILLHLFIALSDVLLTLNHIILIVSLGVLI
jgi:hypothetical protein